MKALLLTVSLSTVLTLSLLNMDKPNDNISIRPTKHAGFTTTKKAKSTLLIDLIAVGESGKRGADSYNRGSQKCTASNRQFVKITGMTIAEIMKHQKKPKCSKDRLYAVGKYQVIDTTLRYCVSALNIPLKTTFNIETQNTIYTKCLAGLKQKPIGNYIKTGTGLRMAAHAVAAEWAAFKSPITGKGVHDKKGNNKATISASYVLTALRNARQLYLQQIAAGANDESAYAAALGVLDEK